MGIRKRLRKYLGIKQQETFDYLQHNIIELNNYKELKKVFGWENDPILGRHDIYDFEYLEDVNERRIRDAESIGTVVKNTNPKTILEIGTSDGMGTLLLFSNAPEAKIYTVNILPEEIVAGKGGKYTTIAPEKEDIGIAFKEKNIENIVQIYANTAIWEPNIGTIDVAFIDGCHDKEFVYNDTLKIIKHLKPGSFLIWHDFNLELVKKYHWIYTVCEGVNQLFQDGFLHGRIFHVKDSWVGILKME
jgi:predicted O-methyltransferase YrrM